MKLINLFENIDLQVMQDHLVVRVEDTSVQTMDLTSNETVKYYVISDVPKLTSDQYLQLYHKTFRDGSIENAFIVPVYAKEFTSEAGKRELPLVHAAETLKWYDFAIKMEALYPDTSDDFNE